MQKLELFALWKIILFSLILWHVQLLRKPYLMVLCLDPILCLVCGPFRTTCSEGCCVCFFKIFIFSTCFQPVNKKNQTRAVFKIVDFFPGDDLYYTDFILIIINLCLYWRCGWYWGVSVVGRWGSWLHPRSHGTGRRHLPPAVLPCLPVGFLSVVGLA